MYSTKLLQSTTMRTDNGVMTRWPVQSMRLQRQAAAAADTEMHIHSRIAHCIAADSTAAVLVALVSRWH